MKPICNIINDLVEQWGESPYDINNGGCEEFAQDLQHLLKQNGYKAYEMTTESYVEFGVLPGHMWVLVDDMHYDAECPQGVNSWKQLPIFAKLPKSRLDKAKD